MMLIAGLAVASFVATAQNSFSYQSVIRNNGEVVNNQDVALLISILNGSEVCYQEVQKVKTNAYGNISVNVGEGEPKTGSFTAIPWETMQIMMQIEVSTDGTENYVNLGQMQIQPVPYTMYAARTTTVIQPKEASEDPIFEVRDSEGNLMFAVYETGVKVYVDDNKNDNQSGKAAKSKFAVAGRSANKGEETLLTIDAEGTTVFVDDNFNDDDNQSAKAAKSKFAVAGRSAKGDNNLITIDGSGSTIYVNDNTNTDADAKAAKSKFAVAGRSAKGNNLLTVDNAGATVYVDDNYNENDNTKAAKSRFAVAGRSAKGDKNIITIDGSGSTIYVDDNYNKNDNTKADTKAAKSKFAVAGRSAKKSENLFTIDGDGSTVYVDFNTDADKAAKSRFAVAGRSAKGAEDALTIDGDQATFYIDIDNDNKNDDYNQNDKAAKSRFAVAGRSAKDVQTAFVVDGSGTLIYIDEWDDSKAAKSTFAVAGRTAQKTNSNFFVITKDSTRIYVNDVPTVDTVSGEVTTPTLASAFAVVGKKQNTDLLVVNRDSTIVKMNTYVEEQVQTTSGVVEKLPDDTKADKVYTTGRMRLVFEEEWGPSDEVNYTYYRNGADEYLYLCEYFNDEHYEYRNYWLVDGKIYRDTTYLKSWNGLVPIYTYRNDLDDYFYGCNWKDYWDTEPFVAEGGSNGGLLTILESKIRQDGYKVRAEEGVNLYYKIVENDEWPAAETERNTVIALYDVDIFNNQNYLATFKSLLESSVAILGKNSSMSDVYSIEWNENYTLLDSCVTEGNILAKGNGEDGFYVYYDSQGNYVDDYVNAADEHELFYYKEEYRKHTLAEIEYMFSALKTGFAVKVTPTNGGTVTGINGGNGTYNYGDQITLTATASDGYVFTGWNDGNGENPRTITVMDSITVWGNFQSLSDYELVDLGLTTKWAKSNLGALSPTSAGGYYAWGETGTKSAYTQSTYTLESSSDFRDAANTILGNNYRMPAIEDWIALKDSCDWEYDPDKGCFKVTSQKNSKNYIFIPATGYFDDYDGYQDFVPDDSYSNCYYLSRSEVEDSYYYFKTFLICSDPSESKETEKYKYYGFQIRPVANTYNVTLVADGNGTVSGGGTFNAGATTTITATAGDGYTFVRWSDGNSDNPRLLAVTEHTNLEAVFADILYVSQADPGLETHNGSEDFPYSSIAEAVSAMESDKNYEIRVVGTIEGPQVISDCPAKVLALTGYGDNAKLDGKGSAANTVTTLSIAANTVIIKNLTITGGYASGSGSASGINVSGNVTIDQGVAVTGNTAANGASIVFVDGGSELHIQSGRIADNTAENAHKGVYLNGWGQYARATLCLSGNPVVEDIYPSRIDNWPDYHHVTLEGNLSGDASINITPYDYYVGLDLVISYVSMADNREHFTVTPNGEGHDWTITDEGKLSYNCTLTFTVNGNVVETRKVLYGEKTKAPDMPQNPYTNEYVFAGWYYENNENLFVKFDFENESVGQDNMQLQPKWLKPSKQLVVNAAYTENDAEGTQAKPFNRIQNALAAIELFDRPEWDYTIVIDGELTGTQEIGPSVVAQKLTLKGKNELVDGVPQDKLKGSNNGAVLTIDNTTTPIVIENLQITGGRSSQGGGICNYGGTLTLESGTLITGNSSNDYDSYEGGAGLFTDGGTVTINSGAVISSNTASKRGGGLALMNGASVTLNGGEIKSNTASRYGGAVMFGEAQYNNQRSTFTMESGTISGNKVTATSGTDGFGGGIYITQGEFILKGGDIINNTAGNTGGAIHNDDTFTMEGGTLSGNKATNGNGGAINNYNTITITGGTISGNTATGVGNAICNKGNDGTFNMGGSAQISADNDVYLSNGKSITILASLTADTVAVVTPEVYSMNPEVQIITASDGENTTKKECGRFFVTPQSGGTYTEWWVKAKGVLTAHERRINVANDADHPYVITSDQNFTMEINGETVTTVKSQQVFITADVFDVTEDRAYYITFRNFEHYAPVSGWGCIGFHNFNPGTTFTYHITLDGENISHGNNSSAMGNSGCDGAIKFVFDAITSGSFTFYDIMHSNTSFGKGVGDVSFELAKGCTFSGTIVGVDNVFTDIKAFFEAASLSTEECSFTITRN